MAQDAQENANCLVVITTQLDMLAREMRAALVMSAEPAQQHPTQAEQEDAD